MAQALGSEDGEDDSSSSLSSDDDDDGSYLSPSSDDDDDGSCLSHIRKRRGKKWSALRLHAEIEFYDVTGTFGDPFWLRRSTVVGIRPNHSKYPLLLSNVVFQLDWSHRVRRLPDGCWQPISSFVLRPGGIQNVATAGLHDTVKRLRKVRREITQAQDDWWQNKSDEDPNSGNREKGCRDSSAARPRIDDKDRNKFETKKWQVDEVDGASSNDDSDDSEILAVLKELKKKEKRKQQQRKHQQQHNIGLVRSDKSSRSSPADVFSGIRGFVSVENFDGDDNSNDSILPSPSASTRGRNSENRKHFRDDIGGGRKYIGIGDPTTTSKLKLVRDNSKRRAKKKKLKKNEILLTVDRVTPRDPSNDSTTRKMRAIANIYTDSTERHRCRRRPSIVTTVAANVRKAKFADTMLQDSSTDDSDDDDALLAETQHRRKSSPISSLSESKKQVKSSSHTRGGACPQDVIDVENINNASDYRYSSSSGNEEDIKKLRHIGASDSSCTSDEEEKQRRQKRQQEVKQKQKRSISKSLNSNSIRRFSESAAATTSASRRSAVNVQLSSSTMKLTNSSHSDSLESDVDEANYFVSRSRKKEQKEQQHQQTISGISRNSIAYDYATIRRSPQLQTELGEDGNTHNISKFPSQLSGGHLLSPSSPLCVDIARASRQRKRIFSKRQNVKRSVVVGHRPTAPTVAVSNSNSNNLYQALPLLVQRGDDTEEIRISSANVKSNKEEAWSSRYYYGSSGSGMANHEGKRRKVIVNENNCRRKNRCRYSIDDDDNSPPSLAKAYRKRAFQRQQQRQRDNLSRKPGNEICEITEYKDDDYGHFRVSRPIMRNEKSKSSTRNSKFATAKKKNRGLVQAEEKENFGSDLHIERPRQHDRSQQPPPYPYQRVCRRSNLYQGESSQEHEWVDEGRHSNIRHRKDYERFRNRICDIDCQDTKPEANSISQRVLRPSSSSSVSTARTYADDVSPSSINGDETAFRSVSRKWRKLSNQKGCLNKSNDNNPECDYEDVNKIKKGTHHHKSSVTSRILDAEYKRQLLNSSSDDEAGSREKRNFTKNPWSTDCEVDSPTTPSTVDSCSTKKKNQNRH